MDQIDAMILRALVQDARASYTAMAERAALSANAVAERIRRMQRDGTIRGFSVDVAPEALGQRIFAFIDLRFAPGVSSQAFESDIAKHPRVLAFMFTTGRSDCTLRVAVGDQDELHSLIEELRGFGALDTYTRIIVREETFPLII